MELTRTPLKTFIVICITKQPICNLNILIQIQPMFMCHEHFLKYDRVNDNYRNFNTRLVQFQERLSFLLLDTEHNTSDSHNFRLHSKTASEFWKHQQLCQFMSERYRKSECHHHNHEVYKTSERNENQMYKLKIVMEQEREPVKLSCWHEEN